jgi:hypothetical protein
MAEITDSELIEAALGRAMQSGGTDEAHHKAWVIDQMVRILTGCPPVEVTKNDCNGKPYTFTRLAENKDYLAFVAQHNAGEDGPESYKWDEGIAP